MRKYKLFAAVLTAAALAAGCGQKTAAPLEETVQKTESVSASTEEQLSGSQAGTVKDGVYSHSAKGNNGDVTVELEIKDGKAVRAEVAEHEETEGLSDKPIAEIPAWIVENQSLAIDAVSGATNLAATYFVAVDTTFQRESGIQLSIDEYVAQTAKTTPNINTDNLKRLLENSQESLDWLNGLGTKINRPISNYQVATEDGSSLGASIVKAMSGALEKSSADLRLETEAIDIIAENNVVKGVKVKDKGGEYSIFADNVVLATGGFVSGEDAVAAYAPDWAGLPSTSAAGSTGEMFKIVENIGGVLSNMDQVRLNPSVHSENGVNSSLSAARAEGGIMVNQEGLRFCNDYYPDYTVMSKWMMEQDGDFVYILIDQAAMDKSKRLQGFKEKGYFLEADTIEELAQKMNVPEENLVQTIENYQKAVETGIDEFGRTNNLSIDFTKPPYYAVTTCPGLQVSLGGILVDENLLVQKQDGTGFTNLYAVGECADDGLFGCAPTNINITFGKEAAKHILNK